MVVQQDHQVLIGIQFAYKGCNLSGKVGKDYNFTAVFGKQFFKHLRIRLFQREPLHLVAFVAERFVQHCT